MSFHMADMQQTTKFAQEGPTDANDAVPVLTALYGWNPLNRFRGFDMV